MWHWLCQCFGRRSASAMLAISAKELGGNFMRRLFIACFAALCTWTVCPSPAFSAENEAADPSRVLKPGEHLDDPRLGKPRTTRDEFHPWTPPKNLAEWEKTAEALRERILVATGLWPMPPKEPLKPIVHGKIDRGDYTIEKVFFPSHPGHYVSGNLYRPKNIKGKVPGVLCPHGHWQNGRFYDAEEKGGASQMEQGAEEHMAGARYPLQARMAQLARMGCVVFHYDMVGNADSRQIDHSAGFRDPRAGLWLQNFMGLQTFNSIRALDFLLSLEDVDAERIGVTGSSGGGTQTFMLCAVDPRPKVAFPAVMVSTNMQGGCICENADYLRIGCNNVAFAALFAPKPLAMSAANDWTIDIETKGLPELRQIYSLYGQGDAVAAKCWPQFGHNYNQVAREMMYNWFNKHLDLGIAGTIKESDFWPVPPADLSVYDERHPIPSEAGDAEELKEYLATVSKDQFAALLPKDARGLDEYRRLVGTAARVMLDDGLVANGDLESEPDVTPGDEYSTMKGLFVRKETGEKIPYLALLPNAFSGTVVIWIDGEGKSKLFDKSGKPIAAVQKLLDAGKAVASADVFLTGEFVAEGQTAALPAVDQNYQGYTFGYNRPVLSNRVRDLLAFITAAKTNPNVSELELVGTGEAGTWALLAAGLAGDKIERTIVDIQGFSFENLDKTSDPMYLPGALRYGGLGGLAALAAPRELIVYGTEKAAASELAPLEAVYKTAKGKLKLVREPLTDDVVAETLTAAK